MSAEPPAVSPKRWMEANGVSKEHRDNVFHFKGGESFDIHDAPGKSKSGKTLNTYILTGLGKFLASGSRNYDNDTARMQSSAVTTMEAIQTILKAQGNEFSGDKKQGYTLTTPELKRGAPLVKNWRVRRCDWLITRACRAAQGAPRRRCLRPTVK